MAPSFLCALLHLRALDTTTDTACSAIIYVSYGAHCGYSAPSLYYCLPVTVLAVQRHLSQRTCNGEYRSKCQQWYNSSYTYSSRYSAVEISRTLPTLTGSTTSRIGFPHSPFFAQYPNTAPHAQRPKKMGPRSFW